MAGIKNLDQLRAEIERLESLTKQQEEKIKHDLHEIKEELTPINIVMKAVSSLTGIKIERTEFMKEGFAFGFSLLFQRLILKAEKKVEHTVYNIIDSAVEGLKKFLGKMVDPSERRKARMDEEDNEA